MAEAKGMSMVGNSWYVNPPIYTSKRLLTPVRIHKPKYMEDDKESPKKDKKKARSKSRTRTMFGLK